MLGMLLWSFRHLEHQNPSIISDIMGRSIRFPKISHLEVIGVQNKTIDLDSHLQISHSRMKFSYKSLS